MRCLLGLTSPGAPEFILPSPEAGGSPEIRSLRPAWPTWLNSVSTKNTKISQAYWYVPAIPATREPEAGESLEVTVSQDHLIELQPG